MGPEEHLRDQIKFLVGQLHVGSVSVDQFMKLLDMAYGDYLELYPDQRPDYYDRKTIDKQFRIEPD